MLAPLYEKKGCIKYKTQVFALMNRRQLLMGGVRTPETKETRPTISILHITIHHVTTLDLTDLKLKYSYKKNAGFNFFTTLWHFTGITISL